MKRNTTSSAPAKLARGASDNLCKRLAEEYPEYGFEQHKGYGTKVHYEMLQEHGPCAIHRRSFIHLD